MTLDRKDYKSAIPQLEKRISEIEQVGEKGLANFDVLKASLEKEVRVRTQALLKTNDRVEIAIESADGKNTIYHSASAPTGGEYKVGDTWFDASNGYAIHTWNGSAWVKEELGEDAIANLSITNAKIANATIQSAKIAGLDVGKLTGGYIDSGHINTGAITVGSLQDGANYSTTTQMNSAIATAKADAEKVATNYLTTISGTTGISVHSANDTSNFANVNSSGMTVYKGGTKVATFGDTATIGKANSTNTVIDSSGFAINSGSTEVATFKVGNVRSGGTTKSATRIEATNEIGIYANGYSSADSGLVIAKEGGAPVFYFGGELRFCPQPHAHATSTYSNISLPNNQAGGTSVPMTRISSSHTFMEIDAGCIKFSGYDGVAVEVTASVYVVPSTNTQATIYLYRYRGDAGTTNEIAAGTTYLSSYGGAVQLVPRVFSPLWLNDKLYIAVRLFSSTGTAYCNHKDTFLDVKYM